jgi:acyl carrier protein
MMKEDNLYLEVRKIISGIIEVEEENLLKDTRFVDDLGVDSMLALEILVAIERKYKVKIPEERLVEIRTLKDSVALTQEYVEARQKTD